MVTSIDPTGISTFYEYDILGRQTATRQTVADAGLSGLYFSINDYWGLVEEQFNGTSVLHLADSENLDLEHTRVDANLNFAEDDHFAGYTDLTDYIAAGWEGAIYIAEAGPVTFYANNGRHGRRQVDQKELAQPLRR